MWNPEQLLEDFLAVAKFAGIELQREAIQIETLPMPHRPPRSPADRQDGSLRILRERPGPQGRQSRPAFSSTIHEPALQPEIGTEHVGKVATEGWKRSCSDVAYTMTTCRPRVMMNIHKELPLSFPGCPPSPDPSPLLHKYRDTTVFPFRLQPTRLEQQRCGVGTVPHGRP